MYALTTTTAQSAFEVLYQRIMKQGGHKDGTKFIRNITVEMLNPYRNNIDTEFRKWSIDYAQLEWEWYLTGNRNPDMVSEKAKLWDTMRDEDGLVFSNYGYWWKRNGQLDKMIALIKAKETTRRAILVHYSPDDVDKFEKDTPCNVVLNFYVQDNKLHLTVFARSIDLWYGFCNDQYCFSRLMMYIAEELDMGVGRMIYMITDLHLYEKHWNKDGLNYNTQKEQ